MAVHPEVFTNCKALVVDEDKRVAKILSTILRAFRFEIIVTAHSAEEARQALGHQHFDCLVVDWLASDRKSLKLVEDIRGNGLFINGEMPIILCTAYTDFDRVRAATASGVDEILVKPVEARSALRKIASAFFDPRFFGANGQRRTRTLNLARSK